MAAISSYVQTQFSKLVADYQQKKQSGFYRWFIALCVPKALVEALEALPQAQERPYTHAQIEPVLQALSAINNLYLIFLGFFFSSFVSRMVLGCRTLEPLQLVTKIENHSQGYDFLSYPHLDVLLTEQDALWQDSYFKQMLMLAAAHDEPLSMFHALVSLHRHDLLFHWPIEKIVSILKQHPHPYSLIKPLKKLASANMLAGLEGHANLQALASHANPEALGLALILMYQLGVLDRTCRIVLLTQHNPLVFAEFLSCLFFSGVMDAENIFQRLEEMVPYASLLTGAHLGRFWTLIPPEGLSKDIYDTIFDILRTPHIADRVKEEQVRALMLARFFQPRPRVLAHENSNRFNPEQSIHTASINQSLRRSLLKLKNCYGPELDVQQCYQQLKKMIAAHGQEPFTNPMKRLRLEAAKRALQRIDAGILKYTDADTGVDVQTLMALIYCAIHDRKRCQAKIEDVIELLIEALYEVQRGYNLSVTAFDNAKADDSICMRGSFVKIFQSIAAIHECCQLVYVTAQSVTDKMIRVVNHALKGYLNNYYRHQTLQESKALFNDLKNNGLSDAIWAELKSSVEATMHEEFDDVLPMSSLSPNDFEAILQTAQEVPLALDNYQFPGVPTNPQFFSNALASNMQRPSLGL